MREKRKISPIVWDKNDEIGLFVREYNLLIEKNAQHLSQREQFVASISHEIRNPLAAISGFAELIEEAVVYTTYKKYIKNITDTSRVLQQLLNDILDLSKADLGKLKINKSPFEVASSLDYIQSSLLFSASEKDVHVFVSASSDVPEKLMGDVQRINQVLLNLASNALKFTKKGSVSVHISVDTDLKNKVVLNYSVADTGIGLTKEQCDRIFAPFVQATDTTEQAYGGTGLGLSISKSLSDLMGGSLSIESEIDKGTKVNFKVPLNKY